MFPALLTWVCLLAGPEEKKHVVSLKEGGRRVNFRFGSQRVFRIESPFIDLENQHGVHDAM